MQSFPSLITAMATPMTDGGDLDFEGAQRLAVHLIEHGSEGLVVAGTTGESPTLTHAETLDLFRAVVEAVDGRAVVIAGTGKNDTAATVKLTQQATGVGVDGILVVAPYYNRPSQRGLDWHFRMAAAATELPVLIYNIPGRTGVEVAPETLLRLAEEVDHIRGVKDAVGDLTKTSWLAARAPERFGIWSGDDAAILPILAVGGVGGVCVASHLVGLDLAHMIEIFPTDPTKAREIHHRLLPLFETLMKADPNPGPLKAALRLLGLPAGPVRPPLADADERVTGLLREALIAAGVQLP
jgi:4-hydroxy-tetrahydrodipicolinate synthase